MSAFKLSIGYITAGNGPHFGYLKNLANFRGTRDMFFISGFHQPHHGAFDILDDVVNYIVKAHINIFFTGESLNFWCRPHVKANDDGIGHRRQGDIGFSDGSGGRVDHFNFYFLIGKLGQGVAQGFDRAVHVGFNNEVEVFDLALLYLLIKLFQTESIGLGQFL